MKIVKFGLAAMGALVLFTGCATTSPADKKTKQEKEIVDKMKKIKASLRKISSTDTLAAKKFAEEQAMNYYNALKNNDYESFCKSKKLSKENFNKWHAALTKIYGKVDSQTYVGAIANPMIIRYMWKWKFTKTAKDGKTFTREALYNVFIVKDKETNKYMLYTTGLQ